MPTSDEISKTNIRNMRSSLASMDFNSLGLAEKCHMLQ